MILTLGSWKKPEIIFSLAKMCYIRRENDEDTTILIQERCDEYLDKFSASILPIDAEVIEISSSEIRSNLKEMSQYLSASVLEYINKAGLYQ